MSLIEPGPNWRSHIVACLDDPRDRVSWQRTCRAFYSDGPGRISSVHISLLKQLLQEMLPKTDIYIYESDDTFIATKKFWPDAPIIGDKTWCYRTNGKGSMVDMLALAKEVFAHAGNGVTAVIEDLPFINVILDSINEWKGDYGYLTLWVGHYH
jgi:hypothetical protein